MPYVISKDFEFSAGHQLFHVPPGHQCGRAHGHNYLVCLTLAADDLPPTTPWIRDYADLAPFKALLDLIDHHFLLPEKSDHLRLNHQLIDDQLHLSYHTATGLYVLPAQDVMLLPVQETTAELLAAYFYDVACKIFPGVVQSVTVKETAKTEASYRGR